MGDVKIEAYKNQFDLDIQIISCFPSSKVYFDFSEMGIECT